MAQQLPDRLPEQEPKYPPPPVTGTALPPEEVYDAPRRRGCSGCAWGVGGALGCLALLILPIIALILAGTISVNSIVSNVRDIFTKPVTIVATQTVLERVQGMSNLTVVRYNYSSLITSEREMPGILAALYGEKQVMVAVGQVNAGIDLSKITPADVTTAENSITVKLPPPVLQECFLNEAASYVVSRDTGLFARSAPNLDTQARQFAVHQFRDNAVEGGILNEVQSHAQEVVAQLLHATAPPNTQVQVVTSPPDVNASLPDSCK